MFNNFFTVQTILDTFLLTVIEVNFLVKPAGLLEVYITAVIKEDETNNNLELIKFNFELARLVIALSEWSNSITKAAIKFVEKPNFAKLFSELTNNVQRLRKIICEHFIKFKTPCSVSSILVDIIAF